MKMNSNFVSILLTSIGIVFLPSVTSECTSYLVETIPEDMIYNNPVPTKDTTKEFLSLINSARTQIDIASYYWTMMGDTVVPDPVPEAHKGEDVMRILLDAVQNRSVLLRIAVNDDANSRASTDLAMLEPYSQIKRLNFTRLVGAGILHTKFLVVDSQSFYIGSTNMDWRALTHVKEMGLVGHECPGLGEDLENIFNVYWYLGGTEVLVPNPWPEEYSVAYNLTNPQSTVMNNQNYEVYFSSSPKNLCPNGRTDDIDAILAAINTAEEYIYIAVMDYFPLYLFTSRIIVWPEIDNALRVAAIERRVQVKLMASKWTNTRASLALFLKSLSAFSNQTVYRGSIETKFFIVPPIEVTIPYSRVNHNKYIITEKVALIGTNNWSGDYFTSTGGASVAFKKPVTGNNDTLHDQLKAVFERDWYSQYAHDPTESDSGNSSAFGIKPCGFVILLIVLLKFCILF